MKIITKEERKTSRNSLSFFDASGGGKPYFDHWPPVEEQEALMKAAACFPCPLTSLNFAIDTAEKLDRIVKFSKNQRFHTKSRK